MKADLATDILAKQSQRTERIDNEATFRLIVESAPNAILVADQNGKIALANAAAERLFGYSRTELLGRTLEELVPLRFKPHRPESRQSFRQGLRAPDLARSLFAVRKDGTQVPVELSLTPIKTPAGTLVVSSLVDTTERKRAEEALIKQARDLEQFGHVSSHDLQEPLRKIASYSQLLSGKYEGTLDEEGEKYLRNISQGASQMQTLIKDLLDYSRLGRQERNREDVDLNQVLAGTIRDMGNAATGSGVEIKSEKLPVVHADALQMAQLFHNLISNAIKFHTHEPPKIQIYAEHREREWVIVFRDNGIGIPPQYRELVFKVFQRLHTRGKYEGTGIGLAICKKIVEQHGGRIWVESNADGGSTFFVALPFHPDDEMKDESAEHV